MSSTGETLGVNVVAALQQFAKKRLPSDKMDLPQEAPNEAHQRRYLQRHDEKNSKRNLSRHIKRRTAASFLQLSYIEFAHVLNSMKLEIILSKRRSIYR